MPEELEGCRTTFIDGYVVVGHVAADVVRKLLTERPAIVRIAIPGMPSGVLKGDLRRATKERALAQDSFEGAVREATPAGSHHILYREELMASVPASDTLNSVRNAFEQWLEW